VTAADVLESCRNRPTTPQEKLLALTVLDDRVARALVAVWPLGRGCSGWDAEKAKAEISDDAPPTQVWDSVWEKIGVNMERLALQTGFPEYMITPRLEQLVDARLLFPDGTVSNLAVEVSLRLEQAAHAAKPRAK
jgi:hypothetical protein